MMDKQQYNRDRTPHGQQLQRQYVGVLPAEYLARGYFNESGHLREELIVAQPWDLATTFEKMNMSAGLLRGFYSHSKDAAQRLEYGESFDAVLPDIIKMGPLVAAAVGRSRDANTNHDLFKDFMDKNIEEAKKSRNDFLKGFVPHFQCVVAYFTYLKPKDRQ